MLMKHSNKGKICHGWNTMVGKWLDVEVTFKVKTEG